MLRFVTFLLIVFNACFASDSDDDYEKNRPTHTIQKSDGTTLELYDKIPIPNAFQKCFNLLDYLQIPDLTVGEGSSVIIKHFEPDLDRSDLTIMPKPLSEFGKWYHEPNPVNLKYVVNFSDEIIAEKKRLKSLVKAGLDGAENSVRIHAALKAFLSLNAVIITSTLPNPDEDIDLVSFSPLANLMRFIDSITNFTEADLAKIIPIDMYKIIFMVSIRAFINELICFTCEAIGVYVDIDKDRDLPFLPKLDEVMRETRTIKCGTKYFAFVNFMLSKNDDANYKYVEFV